MANLREPPSHLRVVPNEPEQEEPQIQQAFAGTGDYFQAAAAAPPAQEGFLDPPMQNLAPLSIRDIAMTPLAIEPISEPAMQISTRPFGMNLTNRSYPMSGLGQASQGATFLPLLLAGGAAVAGGMYGGGWGALAGLLLTGSLTNAYRFMANADGERTAHGTFAVVAAAGGGYAAYRVYKGKRPQEK